jgi:uncharacterized protein YhfF
MLLRVLPAMLKVWATCCEKQMGLQLCAAVLNRKRFSTCDAAFLRENLQENIARITGS